MHSVSQKPLSASRTAVSHSETIHTHITHRVPLSNVNEGIPDAVQNKYSVLSSAHKPDFELYCMETGPMNKIFKEILLISLQLQVLFISLCPIEGFLWLHDNGIHSLVIKFGYFVGANVPNTDNFICTILGCIVWILFYSETIYSSVLRYVFYKRRQVNKYLIYFRTYLSSIIHVFLYPFHQGINGYYLGRSFVISDFNSGAAVLVFITCILAFRWNWRYLGDQQNHVKYSFLLFPVWSLGTVKLLYCCLAVVNFLMYSVPYVESSFVVASFICALIMGLYALWEMSGYRWMRKKDIMIMQSLSCFSVCSLLAIAINCVYEAKGEAHMFWSLMIAVLVILSVNSVLLECRIRRINRILHSGEEMRKIDSALTVLDYLRVGLMSGNKDVLNCTDALDILSKFPFSYDIHFFYAVFTLAFSTCPAQTEALLSAIDSSLKYDEGRSRSFVELQYYVGPISQNHLDKYNRNLIALRNSFVQLIRIIKKCYGIIFMEMTGTLPIYALEFRYSYQDVLFQLRKFVQRYPQSNDGEFFVELLTCMFPKSSDLGEICYWQNRRTGCHRSVLDMFPSILVGSIDSLSILRDLKAGYGPSAVKLDRNGLREIKKTEHCDKRTKLKAPSPLFQHLVTWHLFFITGVLFLTSLISMTLIFRYDMILAKRVADVNHLYQVATKCYVFDAYFYPLILQREAEEYNAFFDPYVVADFLAAIESVQSDIACLSSGLCSSYDYSPETISVTMEFLAKTFEKGPFAGASYAFGLFAASFWQEQLYTQDARTVFLPAEEGSDPVWTTIDYCGEILDTAIGNFVSSLSTTSLSVNEFSDVMRLICMITCLVILVLFTIDILVSLQLAERDFRQLLVTLRQTAKAAISTMQNFFSSLETLIQGKTCPLAQMRVKQTRPVYIFIAVCLCYALAMAIVFISFFVTGSCFTYRLQNSCNMSAEITELFRNMTQFTKNYQKVLFHYTDPAVTKPMINLMLNDASNILSYLWGGEETTKQGRCSLSTSQDLIFSLTNGSEGTEFVFTEFLSNAVANVFLDGANRENRLINFVIAKDFYVTVVPKLIELISSVYDGQAGMRDIRIEYKTWYSLNIVLILFLPLILAVGSIVIDRSYKAIIQLVDRLPEGALSVATLAHFSRKLKARQHTHSTIDPEINHLLFDIFPEAVVVMDQTSAIIQINNSAMKYFSHETEEIVGSKLFETLQVSLSEVGTGVDLRTIIDRYMFSDRTLVATHTVSGQGVDGNDITISLTLVPVLEETEEIKTKGASIVAILLQDITGECQLNEELENISVLPEVIIKNVLPAQLLKPLMNHQRNISFDVAHCCACVVKLCGLQEWMENGNSCNSFVARLASVVSAFDTILQKYETLTRIKMMGCRYCIAGGLFNQGIDPFVYVLETLRFNFDVLEIIKEMKMNDVPIDCRIGVCFSGPVVAGIVGLQLPFFDIFGTIVKTVQELADTSDLNKIHVNGELYSIIARYPFACEKLSDGTCMISLSEDL